MKVSFIKKDNLACVEYNPRYKRAEAIIIKLNLIAWDIVEQSEGKVLFKVEDKEDFEDLKSWVNRCMTHDFYI